MISLTTSRGTRWRIGPMASASLSAGMTTLVRTDARGSGRSEDRGAGAPCLEELDRVGAGPFEVHLLAAHERAVRVRPLDAAGELAAARATAVAARDER